MQNEKLVLLLTEMLQEIPHVTIGTHMRSTNFLVGKKVFAFIKNDGVVLKLPKETIQELTKKIDITPLVMGKRIMKEWVIIHHKNISDFKKDEKLFKEAIQFVTKP